MQGQPRGGDLCWTPPLEMPGLEGLAMVLVEDPRSGTLSVCKYPKGHGIGFPNPEWV